MRVPVRMLVLVRMLIRVALDLVWVLVVMGVTMNVLVTMSMLAITMRVLVVAVVGVFMVMFMVVLVSMFMVVLVTMSMLAITMRVLVVAVVGMFMVMLVGVFIVMLTPSVGVPVVACVRVLVSAVAVRVLVGAVAVRVLVSAGAGGALGPPLIGRGMMTALTHGATVWATTPDCRAPRDIQRTTAIAAPKPLSMLTTVTPAAQLDSMPSNAARPPSDAP
jgi:hypothetical protein